MSNKITLNKKPLIGLLLVIAGVLIIFKFTVSTESKASLNAWEDVHQWRVEGECAECHSDLEHVKQGVDEKHTLAIPAAKTHTEQFRRFTHGKDKQFASYSCQSCHEPKSCTTCHAILPETHTSDFIEPTGHSDGSLRHAMLAKTSITSCSSCHQSFIQTCTSCHSMEEVQPWQKQGAKGLSRWNQLLNPKRVKQL